MDDLCSFCPIGQCVRLLSQLRQVLASGGFRLTKIMSNSKSILSDCSAEDQAVGVVLSCGKLPLHKALGVYWNATND